MPASSLSASIRVQSALYCVVGAAAGQILASACHITSQMDFLKIIGKVAGPVGQIVQPLTNIGIICSTFDRTRPGHMPSPEELIETLLFFPCTYIVTNRSSGNA